MRRKNKNILDPRYLEIGYREIRILSPRVRKKLLQFIQKSLSERRKEKSRENI